MSSREFVALSLLGCGLQLVYSLLTIPAHRRATRPVNEWLSGDRSDPRATAEAWRAAARLPSQLVRRYFLSASLGLAVWSIYLLWSLCLVWELKLPAYSI